MVAIKQRVAEAWAEQLLCVTRAPKVAHTYYAEPYIRVSEDWNTKKIKVYASLGIAPDSHTIIEYPVTVWLDGYWNRATTRAVITQVKKRFLAECALLGYVKSSFTKPLEIKLFWEV